MTEHVYTSTQVAEELALPYMTVYRYGCLLFGSGHGRSFNWTAADMRQVAVVSLLRSEGETGVAHRSYAAANNKYPDSVLLSWAEPVRNPLVSYVVITPGTNEVVGHATVENATVALTQSLRAGEFARLVYVPDRLRDL